MKKLEARLKNGETLHQICADGGDPDVWCRAVWLCNAAPELLRLVNEFLCLSAEEIGRTPHRWAKAIGDARCIVYQGDKE